MDDVSGFDKGKLKLHYGGERFKNALLVLPRHDSSKYTNVSLLIDGVLVGLDRKDGNMVSGRLTSNSGWRNRLGCSSNTLNSYTYIMQ